MNKYMPGIFMIVLAIGLFMFSFTNFCQKCEGWDVWNPLCKMGELKCQQEQSMVHTIMKVCSALFIFVAIKSFWKVI